MKQLKLQLQASEYFAITKMQSFSQRGHQTDWKHTTTSIAIHYIGSSQLKLENGKLLQRAKNVTHSHVFGRLELPQKNLSIALQTVLPT